MTAAGTSAEATYTGAMPLRPLLMAQYTTDMTVRQATLLCEMLIRLVSSQSLPLPAPRKFSVVFHYKTGPFMWLLFNS